MKRTKALAVVLAILMVGLVAGFALGYSQNHTQLWDQVADRETNDLMNRINILSQLRIGRTDEAIRSMELFIDTQVVNIAYSESENFNLRERTIKPHRLKALQMAKTYRDRYPSTSTQVRPSPESVLAQIPSLSLSAPPKECNSAFCRLFSKTGESRSADE